MSKWFEVSVQVWKRVLVEVEDSESAEDALDVASQEFLCGHDGEASTVSDEPLTELKLETARRHADEVLSLS
jgi:hypothetical protein